MARDIAAWLRGLGLERYEPAFHNAEVTADVLPDLTEADLERLGLPLGPRKKLLRAIASLGSEHDPETAPAGPIPRVRQQAERRQLTVMFVDLVGSTPLSARLDPEDMREVLRAYQNAVAGEVSRLEGHVAKFMGDGVLAYFGWPRAHEDEAERAVRAGLAIAAAVARLTGGGDALACRVGIATGLVVVGDLVGEGAAQEEAVIGDTPNLASRLQEVAEPGAIVISAATRRLVGELFQLEDLGPLALKGLASEQHGWRVLAAGPIEDRFAALHVPRALVGRDQELAIMLDHWHQAAAGSGRTVLIQGEPGIGKSRLIAALREKLEGMPLTTLRYQGSPHSTNSALWPIIEQLEHALGPAQGLPPSARLDQIDALVVAAGGDPQTASPMLAALLGMPTADRYPVIELSPRQRKRHTFDVLIAQMVGLARRGPVLILVEDAHWLDHTTRELLEAVLERVPAFPILLVVTQRSGGDLLGEGRPNVTVLKLDRLSRTSVEAIIQRVAGGKALPPAVMAAIQERTDGVPLFVEELTKIVLESGLLDEAADGYDLRGPLPLLAIPSTLHDSLLARLDRLAPVKEIAQIGAVIGREFSYELLAAVARRPDGELREALDRLVDAELLYRQGTPPLARYVFKHALVRDTAYDSLLRNRRQYLHASIATVLEERFPDTAQMQPELLARHCAEAGLVEKAVEYRWRAGQLANGRSALAEAVEHFAAAVELLAALPETPAHAERELDLLIAQGSALISVKGQAAAETGAVYARALELCQRIDGGPRQFPLLFGRWVFHMVRAEHAAAQRMEGELLQSARRTDDATGLLVGHRAAGIGALWRGELVEARGHLQRTLALYDPDRHRLLAATYGYDLRLAGLAGLAFVLSQLGYPNQGVARCLEAVEDAKRQGHPAGLAYALYHACMLAQLRGDVAGLSERASELAAVADEHGFALWQAGGMAFDGWLLAQRGAPASAIARIEDGLVAYRATGAALFVPYFLALLATICGAGGQVESGRRLLTEALEVVDATGERWFEAELHRLKGELSALASADRDAAEHGFRRALAVSRAQGAKLWELRAATSLARLWVEQNRRAEAGDLLAPIYGWFTEGFDTPDLIQAKQLLDVLA